MALIQDEGQIVQRTASDDLEAWKWANAAAQIGWRVVTCFQNLAGSFCVWAEAPYDADPDAWDRQVERGGD